MARTYRLRRRGDDRDRTRQRIVDAAIHLHQTKGLAATSVSEIARRASVGRVTVYRHFPDEAALLGACSGQYFERHPLPDPEAWRSIRDATERLRRGLRETYAYHRETEAMMTRVHAEAGDRPVMAPYHAHWQAAADVLADAWPATGRRKAVLRAGLSLALGFDTWRTLVRVRGLTREEAVELMLRLACDRRADDDRAAR